MSDWFGNKGQQSWAKLREGRRRYLFGRRRRCMRCSPQKHCQDTRGRAAQTRTLGWQNARLLAPPTKTSSQRQIPGSRGDQDQGSVNTHAMARHTSTYPALGRLAFFRCRLELRLLVGHRHYERRRELCLYVGAQLRCEIASCRGAKRTRTQKEAVNTSRNECKVKHDKAHRTSRVERANPNRDNDVG